MNKNDKTALIEELHPVDAAFVNLLKCLDEELQEPTRSINDTTDSIICFVGRLNSIRNEFYGKQRDFYIATRTV